MAEPQQQYAAGLADRLSQPAQLLGWRTLRGTSGHRYAFGVLDAEGELPPVGGVFCLANRQAHANGLRSTELLRIGQTDDLKALGYALRGREYTPFNAVCVYLEGTEFIRRLIVREVAAEMKLAPVDTGDRGHFLRRIRHL